MRESTMAASADSSKARRRSTVLRSFDRAVLLLPVVIPLLLCPIQQGHAVTTGSSLSRHGRAKWTRRCLHQSPSSLGSLPPLRLPRDIRGGAVRPNSTTTSSRTAPAKVHGKNNKQRLQQLQQQQKSRRAKRNIAVSTIVIGAIYLRYRKTIHRLVNKETIQETVLSILHKVDPQSTRGILAYVAGFTVWEALGLSTIPVETAAGMAFGFRRGLWSSCVGKLLGVAISVALGRTYLNEWVRRQFASTRIIKLLDESVQTNPLGVAVLMRYSVLPELLVNFGSALLYPIKMWMILLATVLHGVPFSCLWALLGADTALRLEQDDVPPNQTLRVLMVAGGVMGFALIPLINTWWIRDLHRQSQTKTPTVSKGGRQGPKVKSGKVPK